MYRPSLSPSLLDKAVKELNEPFDSRKKLEAITLTRKKFKEKNPGIKLEREDDAFILRFLRARKFNLDRTVQILTNYHLKRSRWPELFERVDSPALIYRILDAGAVLPLKGKAKDGSTVIVGRPGLEENPQLTDFYAAFFLTLERLLENDDTQINGITVVQDLAYFNLDIAKQMTPVLARRFTGIIQDVMPVRVRSINVTNEPVFFDIVFTIVHPFLSKKMRERVQLHGSEFSKLYKVVDKSVLPFMFAGSGEELNALEWKEEVVSEDTAL